MVGMLLGRHGRKAPRLVEKPSKKHCEVENQYTPAKVEHQHSQAEYLLFQGLQVERL
jgi:hypothetical protein